MTSNFALARPWRELGVKFYDRQAFSEFCAALIEDHIPFTVGGGHTVFIAEDRLQHLPYRSAAVFDRLKTDARAAGHPVDVYDADDSAAEEYDPTPEEAQEAVRRLLGKD